MPFYSTFLKLFACTTAVDISFINLGDVKFPFMLREYLNVLLNGFKFGVGRMEFFCFQYNIVGIIQVIECKKILCFFFGGGGVFLIFLQVLGQSCGQVVYWVQ